ncbi:uncharacterized protein MELLADRAFT_78756 [Melampsora larici-populina 98AG31]|uniref:Uncharacterized protein n=1 Tax=Melampsora larici-populina (strain 98AG31 / pathotype 3-4-7) TaxID=747676 RepID=F4RY98_MELLP|nr:uncharacterized protein MELLADRAFT_78756 [Melampsora larici-populina 98AG31]EGG02675.1 hypothetical protein MELLADRAFT_78756 [Melampsora larici-populina 98AG31]
MSPEQKEALRVTGTQDIVEAITGMTTRDASTMTDDASAGGTSELSAPVTQDQFNQWQEWMLREEACKSVMENRMASTTLEDVKPDIGGFVSPGGEGLTPGKPFIISDGPEVVEKDPTKAQKAMMTAGLEKFDGSVSSDFSIWAAKFERAATLRFVDRSLFHRLALLLFSNNALTQLEAAMASPNRPHSWERAQLKALKQRPNENVSKFYDRWCLFEQDAKVVGLSFEHTTDFVERLQPGVRNYIQEKIGEAMAQSKTYDFAEVALMAIHHL